MTQESYSEPPRVVSEAYRLRVALRDLLEAEDMARKISNKTSPAIAEMVRRRAVAARNQAARILAQTDPQTP